MIDKAKRNTLKSAAAIGIGIAAAVASPIVLARIASTSNRGASQSLSTSDGGLALIQVSTRLDPTTNDLEVIIINTSESNTTISHMTPAQINTARGRFNFHALFENGDLRLAPGESLGVPIQHHAVVLDGSPIHQRRATLTQSLQRHVSLTVNGDTFAATTVAGATGFS